MILKKLNRPVGQQTAYDEKLWDELERFSYDLQTFFKLNSFLNYVTNQPAVSAGEGIKFTSLYIRCESDGGAVNITADPQIQAGTVDGQILTIEFTSDVNTLTLENGNGLLMGASFTGGDGDIIQFSWNKTRNKWVMITSDTK